MYEVACPIILISLAYLAYGLGDLEGNFAIGFMVVPYGVFGFYTGYHIIS